MSGVQANVPCLDAGRAVAVAYRSVTTDCKWHKHHVVVVGSMGACAVLLFSAA